MKPAEADTLMTVRKGSVGLKVTSCVLTPSMLRKGRLIRENTQSCAMKAATIPMTSATTATMIRRGLRMVTGDRSGTAYDAFRGFPIAVAGKTGTAEKKPGDDYAWFMGYAPADDPEILVVALIEQGGHGSSIAAPAVRRVLEAYFNTESSAPAQVEVTE